MRVASTSFTCDLYLTRPRALRLGDANGQDAIAALDAGGLGLDDPRVLGPVRRTGPSGCSARRAFGCGELPKPCRLLDGGIWTGMSRPCRRRPSGEAHAPPSAGAVTAGVEVQALDRVRRSPKRLTASHPTGVERPRKTFRERVARLRTRSARTSATLWLHPGEVRRRHASVCGDRCRTRHRSPWWRYPRSSSVTPRAGAGITKSSQRAAISPSARAPV
jgi:hypothetical protein